MAEPDAELQPLRSHDPLEEKRSRSLPDPRQSRQPVQHRFSTLPSKKTLSKKNLTSQDSLKAFVKQNITARRCKKRKPAGPPNTDNCECGNPLTSHPEKGELCGPDDKWKWKTCTEQFASNAFGDINFIGKNYHTTAKYCRVAKDTDVQLVSELLKKHWNLLPPQLLIHVTGGAKDFSTVTTKTEKALDRFNKGFTSAVDKAKAWVFTGGNDSGVMKMVGNAFAYHRAIKPRQKITCIGMATWGIVNDNKSLINTNGLVAAEDGVNHSLDYRTYVSGCDGLWPAEHNMALPTEDGTCHLNPNHTHFLLVDAGKGRKKFGADVKFADRVVNFIKTNRIEGSEKNEEGAAASGSEAVGEDTAAAMSSIPLVVLVVEGGPNTLFTVEGALESGNPVVCLKGLGGAADVLAAAYSYTTPDATNSKESVLGEGYDEFITQHPAFQRLTGTVFHTEDRSKLLKALKTCLKRRDLLTIVDITDPKALQLDIAILEAIFNCSTSHEENPDARAQRLLKFAMQWNQCDLAKEHIFSKTELCTPNFIERIKLGKNMTKAIKWNRTDFVQLFNGVGLSTTKWLTDDILAKLYTSALNKKTARDDHQMVAILEHSIAQNTTGKRDATILRENQNHNRVESHEQMKKRVEQERKLCRENLYAIGQTLSCNLGQYIHNPYKLKNGEIVSVFNDDDALNNNPFAIRDLFLFSLLLNRQEMALYFWKQGTEFIGSALIASMLLKNLANKARQAEANDIADYLKEQAAEWEVRAIEITKFCYSWDPDRCNQLLLRALPQWCFMTPLSIANEAECMDFMSLPACQSLLTIIWTGRMASYTPRYLIFFAAIFPPLVYKINFHVPVLKMENLSEYHEGSFQEFEDRKRKTVRKVALWMNEEDKADKICLLSAVWHFYRSPATKFVTHAILSNCVILGLFAYFIVSGMRDNVNLIEMVIWGWMGILAMHELKQAGLAQMILPKELAGHLQLTGLGRCRVWISDGWNIMDVTSLAFLLLAIILRIMQNIGIFSTTGLLLIIIRTIYSASYCVFVLRQMYNFHAAKNLGPYVIAIGKMLVDLSFFLLIFMVVMFAFNVPLVALQFNHLPIRDWAELLTVLKRIVYDPMWYQFEAPQRDDYDSNFKRNYSEPIDDNGTCNNYNATYSEFEGCQQPNPIIAPLMLIYLIITNTLLINTLIAMFSYTFDQVKASSDQLWRFYQYDFIREFADRPALAPPFMFLEQIVSAVYTLTKRVTGIYTPYEDTYFTKFYGTWPAFLGLPNRGVQILRTLQDSNYRKLTDFERHGLDQYKEQQDAKSKADSQEQLVEINDRVTSVADEMEHNSTVEQLESRIDQMQVKMESQFAEIIKLLKEKK